MSFDDSSNIDGKTTIHLVAKIKLELGFSVSLLLVTSMNEIKTGKKPNSGYDRHAPVFFTFVTFIESAPGVRPNSVWFASISFNE